MARIMKKAKVNGLAGGGFRDIIVAPAGKKLEVLGWWLQSLDLAFTLQLWNLQPPAAGEYVYVHYLVPPAGTLISGLPFAAPVVLHAAEKLQTFCQPAGCHYNALITYVEVDE